MSDRIKDKLEKLLLSPAGIADRLNVAAATVDRWVDGTREPGFYNGLRLARQLRVNPWWLAFGEGPENEIGAVTTSGHREALRAAEPSTVLTKLGIQLQTLVRETKGINSRLKRLESRDQSGQAKTRRDRPRA